MTMGDILNFRTPSDHREQVIALHCSGANGGQWAKLGETLGNEYNLFAPDFYGNEETGPWLGDHRFMLADEAERVLSAIDAAPSPVHLIGHSYGGGVALHIALARRERIASLTLYEPSAFQILTQIGERGAVALRQILQLISHVRYGVVTGDYRDATKRFVDYWNGAGSWGGLKPSIQAALTRFATKAALDFQALIMEPTPIKAYRRLEFPVLIMRGEHAPRPTRVIAEELHTVMPASRLNVIEGAGHMGPLSHADEVNALIAEHIANAIAGRAEPPLDISYAPLTV